MTRQTLFILSRNVDYTEFSGVSVEQILGNILRILCPPGAAMIAVFNRGLDISRTANTQNTLVVDMDAVVMTELIVDAPIAFIRAFHMDLFHLLSDALIRGGSAAQLAGRPLMIR